LSLSGPDAHGYHGFDWAVVDDAAKSVYRASKGGWLPGQGSGATFMTGGFGFVIAQNGNGGTGVTTNWYDAVLAAAQKQPWSDKDLFVDFGMPSLAGPLDIIGFKCCQRSPVNRKLAAGDDKKRGDCATRTQSPSRDPRCLLW
jgi:hypothetical protein